MAELTIKPFLKATDFDKAAIVTFLDGGQNEEIIQGEGKDPRKTFEISVKLPSGETKTWTMNKTSQGRVSEAYGFDPSKWVGKSAPIYSIDQQVGKEMKQVVYAHKLVDWPEGIKPKTV